MSELKAYKMVNELYCTNCPSVIPAEVYFKSEADKVIAELKSDIADLRDDKKLTDAILDERNAEIVELKKACNDKDDWCLHTLKENRHQKHKRCLAMAEWCEVTALWCYQAANTLPIGFRATLYGKPVMIEPSRLFKRSARLNNWVNRWLALAEEPTWAKFLQLIHKEAK